MGGLGRVPPIPRSSPPRGPSPLRRLGHSILSSAWCHRHARLSTRRCRSAGGQFRTTAPHAPLMPSQRATRAAAASANAMSASTGVDKGARRISKKKAARPPRPSLGPLAAAVRELHNALPGGTFHASSTRGSADGPLQPNADPPSLPPTSNSAPRTGTARLPVQRPLTPFHL